LKKEEVELIQANLAAALVIFGRPEKVWPLLKHQPDPTLRSLIIERLGPAGAEIRVLVAGLDNDDVLGRRAALLSLGERARQAPSESRMFLPELQRLFVEDTDPGVHGAAEWLLRKWDESEWVGNRIKELAMSDKQRLKKYGPAGNGKGWLVN